MKSPISNETQDRFRAVYHDGECRIVRGSNALVNRLMAESVDQVWDGPYSYTSHDRMLAGAWVSIDECRC